MRMLLLAIAFLLLPISVNAQGNELTARQYLPDVEQIVIANHGSNVTLVQVSAQSGTDLLGLPLYIDAATGKASMWLYVYYSPDDDKAVIAIALHNSSIGMYVDEIDAVDWDPQANSHGFEGQWVDSDEAATAWLQYGLQGYLDSHSGAQTERMLLLASTALGDLWLAELSKEKDQYHCSIGASTKEMVACGILSNIGEVVAANHITVGQVNPNPISQGSSAHIDVTTHTASSLRVSVYDIQGRLQGIIYDHQIQPSTMNFVIPSELISRPGVYFVRLESPTDFISRKLVVTR